MSNIVDNLSKLSLQHSQMVICCENGASFILMAPKDTQARA